MSKPVYLCDANLVIRLLQWDDKKLSPIAKRVFQDAEDGKCTLYFSASCVAEIVWVLTSFYRQDRAEVARVLGEFLQRPGIKIENAKIMQKALVDLRTMAVDFLDAYQARLALARGYTVMSFDRDFEKWPELKWKQPT